MHQQPVGQQERMVVRHAIRRVVIERRAHPAVAAHVPADGVIRVGGMVHETDPFDLSRRSGAAVVDPATGLAEDTGLTARTSGVGQLTSAELLRHRLGNPDSQEAEVRLTQRDRLSARRLEPRFKVERIAAALRGATAIVNC